MKDRGFEAQLRGFMGRIGAVIVAAMDLFSPRQWVVIIRARVIGIYRDDDDIEAFLRGVEGNYVEVYDREDEAFDALNRALNNGEVAIISSPDDTA